ncbi:response regulator [Haloglomus litoreum]|uniref:hybrid sensor histidine kinase/response regulator n=1 Tax=Haloglomus litoreum TaxID=3034026 RepID=UPI0023E7A71D|nr:GAF domain-containing protein [Haloglomus sp. DT116]
MGEGATGRAADDTGREGPVRVLVVDDEPDVAELTAQYLERAAEDLSTAVEYDAEGGLERLDRESFDCVVSDYQMPGRNGIEFLQEVRATHPDLPFILFTGKGSEELASEAIGAGVTNYLRKETGTDHYEVLARQVTDTVARRQAEAEVAALNRINRTLRETTQAAVRADSRKAVEQAVCDCLADSDPYLFAWVGRVDADDEVVPSTWAGIERGYLDSITVTADRSETGLGPAGRAVRTHEPQAMQNVDEAPAFEPWREAARERGYRSSASVPLVYGDTRYGVLNLYAGRSDAFDDRELSVLEELGTTIAHAIDRVELTDRLRAQYRDLFEEAPVMAVLTRNEEGRPFVDDCNRRFLETLGYDRAAVVDRPLDEFYTPDSVRALLDEGGYARALSDEFTREERTLLTSDGEQVDTLLRAVPREDADGAVVGSLALYVDITDRKQLERENERLDAFTSIVSHDLRNPLNVIQGTVDLIQRGGTDEDIERVARAADRMERLIDDLLALARQGEAVGETQPVDLGRMAERAWGNVETRDATLMVDSGLATVEADPERLVQLLENLYRNSVEHGGPGVTVTVEPLADADGFAVADDGPGIPPADRETVFEQGYSSDTEGTGFGLAIVETIAEAHGWTVTLVESDDGGARFEFRGVEPASAT